MTKEELYAEYCIEHPMVQGYREVTYECWLEKQVIDSRTEAVNENAVLRIVSNWGELKNACLHSKQHDTFMACLHKNATDAMICFSPAHCPMIKKWSKCNKNSPCC